MIDEPGKSARVQRLGHGVTILARFLHLQWYLGDVAAYVNLALKDDALKVFELKADERRHGLENLMVIGGELATLAVHVEEGEVAQPQDGREHAEYALAHFGWYLCREWY